MNAERRREQSGQLGAAIEKYISDIGFTGVLGDWMVIGSVVRVDGDGDAESEYFVAMTGGTMLQHHALGLLAKAEDVLDEGIIDE